MSLTAEDVIRLARQARFSLSPEEIDRYRAQLNSVLQQMAMLAELEPIKDASDAATTGVRLRADDSTPDKLTLPLDRLTDHLVAGFFVVPRVLGDGRAP